MYTTTTTTTFTTTTLLLLLLLYYYCYYHYYHYYYFFFYYYYYHHYHYHHYYYYHWNLKYKAYLSHTPETNTDSHVTSDVLDKEGRYVAVSRTSDMAVNVASIVEKNMPIPEVGDALPVSRR